jgi:hypothetical protein
MVARRLSPERLRPYLAICTGDLAAAIALYEWNGEVGGAWWSVIGQLEVILRNAIHERLTAQSIEAWGDARWYLTYGPLFPQETQRLVAEARRRAAAGAHGETPGRVVAELSLGFWRFLLAARYERSLWVPSLRFAFPHLLGQGMRRQAHDAVQGLHGLRNRIAHHEPIHDRSLDELHRTALRVVGWICPMTAEWIRDRSAVPGLLRRRPGRLGSPNLQVAIARA